jgi:hypothetical protein
MLQRIAALPLALSAVFLFACDDGGDDGNAGTDGSTGDVTTTTDPGTTTDPSTTTVPGTSTDDSTTDDSTTDDSTTDGESSTGDDGSSSTGGDGSSSTGDVAIGIADVAGTYIETYGPGKTDFQTHIVTATDWTIDFGEFGMAVHTYEQINNEERWVAGDEGDGTYTRYDWDLDDDGNLRYCTAVFGAATLQDAIDAPASDRDDFDGVGCGGMFPWSLLVAEE